MYIYILIHYILDTTPYYTAPRNAILHIYIYIYLFIYVYFYFLSFIYTHIYIYTYRERERPPILGSEVSMRLQSFSSAEEA